MIDQKHTPEQRAALDELGRDMEEARIPELSEEEYEDPANRRFWDPLIRKTETDK